MANTNLKVGDTIWFSSVAVLVNEGTVEAIEGPYLKIKTRCPGVDYVMAADAFPTKEELRKSRAYGSAWAAQQASNQYQRSFTNMADMRIF